MPRKNTGPLAIFGIRIKSIAVVTIFLAALLAVVTRDEIGSLFAPRGAVEQMPQKQHERSGDERDIVVDEAMLSKAIENVKTEKLAEMERGDGSIPTDRFFYIVELVSGGDLEGVDLTIEPEQVIIVSEGGTRTTINRTDVKQIYRHKLPPSRKE
ncbi:MAG: hypothetical protein LJE64_10410 [Desulfofustis sp.]|nr:hypothetical protein [Desulfofustis sp.]